MAATAVQKIPGPWAIPVVGPYWNFLRLYISPIPIIRRQYQLYGKISLAAAVAIDEGQKGAVFALGPEFNQQVLSNPALFYSPGLGGAPDTPLGRLASGLVFMNGETHRQQRRLAMPSFHKKYIESYRDDMVSITRQMLDRWQIGERLDMAQEMRLLTMRIANKTLFGLDTSEESRANLGAMIKQWLALNVSPLARLLPYNLPGSAYRKLLQTSQELEQKILTLIAEKRAAGAAGNDVLSTLLQARDEDGSLMTDTQLIGQATVLFIAGHETSANVLTWTLFLLAQHPEVLAAVRQEIESTLAGNAPRVEHLVALPTLERAIKEAMRLLPPLVFAQRDAIDNFDIGPFHLPKGSAVFISHFHTHHLPELYPDPERFAPDRWLSIEPTPYEYLPFSAGPRMCIGATFAMLEMKLVLAMILQHCQPVLPADSRVDYVAIPTLSPKNGLPMLISSPNVKLAPGHVSGSIRELVDLP
jgi:cytochrome P450